MDNQWKNAGVIYTSTIVLLKIIQYGNYSLLENNILMILFISRIFIGMLAPDYVLYLVLGDTVLQLIRSYLLKNQSVHDIIPKILGILLGYFLSRSIYHPIDSLDSLKKDIIKPPPNPYREKWKEQYEMIELV